nr:DUF86 domain-containing protein [Evansella caseinilytica]
MYFVDRGLLEKRLLNLEKYIALFSEQEEWKSPVERLALERMSHVMIEIIIDVGNQMIDGFIMRDPGSYEDIVDILVDEGVVAAYEGESYKRFIGWRKKLLQEYGQVDHRELLAALLDTKTHLAAFPKQVRRYLKNELGPVSAFLP